MLIPKTTSPGCRRLSTGLLFGLWAAVVGGCTPEGTNSGPKPTSNIGAPAKTDDEVSNVLPPQSEPPVDEDKSASEDPEMSQPNQEAPSDSDVPDAESTTEAGSSDNAAGKVHVLFDGKDLENWDRSNFGGEGEVEVVDGAVIMQRGSDLTGIHWTGKPLPKVNYEVTLEAQRIDGSDFFCGIVFPVDDSFCSFVAGGWGGSVIGLSSVDDIYAAENETGTYASFKDKTWYKFRLRVSDTAITAWIDDEQKVHLKTKGRKLSVHPAVAPAKPFGVSCFATVAGVKNIQLRELTEKEIAAEAEPTDEDK